uniref:Uncharacterized protein n=1 Tax=Timema douglasi TaxID=61478 RepID=A0A7R8V9K4_TIMDO|nr:unnamed protein product [Timema douglasi]
MKVHLQTELDTPIKSEVILKEEIHDFGQLEYEPDFISLPPIIKDLDALQGNSECSNFTEQFKLSQVKSKSEIISALKPKRKRATCKEDGCSTYYALKGVKCGEHGGTWYKCKEEGCCKYAKRGVGEPVLEEEEVSLHSLCFYWLHRACFVGEKSNLNMITELDTPTKSEVILKEEIHDFEQLEYEPDFISLPPIIEDLDALQGNSECSNFTEQFRFSEVKFKSEIISALKPKRKRATCKEEGCSIYALKGGKCGEHGGTRNKCKEEGCCKYAKRGDNDGLAWKLTGHADVANIAAARIH